MNEDIAVKEMKKYLNIPDDFDASFDDMYKVARIFEEMTGNDQEVSPYGMVCWLDRYGNFTEKTDKLSKIVNRIFMGLGKDMPQLFPFIELCANDYKEE